MPVVRDILDDKKEGLGIPLDFSMDPLTVVARGAAIFAGTQRVTTGAGAVPHPEGSSFTVDLDYKATGPDLEFTVGGRVLGPKGQDFAGCTIEFATAEKASLAIRGDSAFRRWCLLDLPCRRKGKNDQVRRRPSRQDGFNPNGSACVLPLHRRSDDH